MVESGFEPGSFELKSYHLLPAGLSNACIAQRPPGKRRVKLGVKIQPLLPLPNHASWPRDDQTQRQDSFLQFGQRYWVCWLQPIYLHGAGEVCYLGHGRVPRVSFPIGWGKGKKSKAYFYKVPRKTKGQNHIISMTMKEEFASKGHQSPWPFLLNGYFEFLARTGSKSWFLTSKFFSARSGKTRHRQGRIPIGKVKLQLQPSKVPPKSSFPGWVWRERARKIFRSWYSYQRGCTSIVQSISFSSVSAMEERMRGKEVLGDNVTFVHSS